MESCRAALDGRPDLLDLPRGYAVPCPPSGWSIRGCSIDTGRGVSVDLLLSYFTSSVR